MPGTCLVTHAQWSDRWYVTSEYPVDPPLPHQGVRANVKEVLSAERQRVMSENRDDETLRLEDPCGFITEQGCFDWYRNEKGTVVRHSVSVEFIHE